MAVRVAVVVAPVVGAVAAVVVAPPMVVVGVAVGGAAAAAAVRVGVGGVDWKMNHGVANKGAGAVGFLTCVVFGGWARVRTKSPVMALEGLHIILQLFQILHSTILPGPTW